MGRMVDRTTRITLVTLILLHGFVPAVHGALPGGPSQDGLCACCATATHEHADPFSHESEPVEQDPHHPVSCTLCQAVDYFAARPACTAPTDLTLTWIDAEVSDTASPRVPVIDGPVELQSPPGPQAVSLPMLK